MVAGFSRSFSLPGSPRPKPAASRSYHVRSVSLPCRSHPIVSRLEDEVRSVRVWQSTQPEPACASASASAPASTSGWLCDGLTRLELLHASLNDFISLPHNQESLRSGSASEWTGRILDDFLRFADAHSCFRSEMVSMNEHRSDAEIAERRNDAAMLASCSRSMRKNEKEIAKLALSLRDISKSAMKLVNGVEDAELAGIVTEVISVTASASAAVFLGVAAVSSTALAAKKSSWTTVKSLTKRGECEGRGDAMERLEGFEECIGAVEKRGERLLRRLVNTRVSLLNTMTH